MLTINILAKVKILIWYSPILYKITNLYHMIIMKLIKQAECNCTEVEIIDKEMSKKHSVKY